MILYEVFPNKTLKILEDEKTYITENLISSVHIKLPSTFGDYPVKELTAELRFYFPEGDYMAYDVDTQQARPEVPITNDITEKPQTLSVMLFFYKGGNVIGKTNSVDKVILDAPLKGEPLTPRAEFDEVIAEQRETIAEQTETISEQAETITEQAGTISSQGEQITELSGEVAELQGEVAEKQATITRQNTTIDELNRREPPLQTLDPINPTTEQVTYNPESPNIGFPQVIVNAPTAEGLNFDFADLRKGVKFLDGVGTYAPTYGTTSQGIYCFLNDDGLSSTVDIKLNGHFEDLVDYRTAFSNSTVITKLHIFGDIVSFGINNYQDCGNLLELTLPQNLRSLKINNFMNINSLRKLILPHGFETTTHQNFYHAQSLEELWLPNTLTFFNTNNFTNIPLLKYVTLENGFNCSISFLSRSTLYSTETIVGWLNALKDLTGETAKTLTIGTTNLNKLTAEQKAIATNKNWNLA